jgi:hypothetical protein
VDATANTRSNRLSGWSLSENYEGYGFVTLPSWKSAWMVGGRLCACFSRRKSRGAVRNKSKGVLVLKKSRYEEHGIAAMVTRWNS